MTGRTLEEGERETKKNRKRIERERERRERERERDGPLTLHHECGALWVQHDIMGLLHYMSVERRDVM